MAKPVTGLVVFGAATLDSTASLDSNYAALQAATNDLNTYTNQLTDTSGAPNAIVVTSGPNLTASLAFGLLLYIKIANTNTSTAVTINLNGLGARVVTVNNGTAPAVGSLVAGGVYGFIYDGTNFQAVGIFTSTLLTSNNTWTGTNTFNAQALFASDGSGGNTGWAIKLNSTIPVIGWSQTTGAADSKIWADFISGQVRNFSIFTDAFGGEKDWLVVTRAADVISSIAVGNATDKPAITLNGPVTIPAPAAGIGLSVGGPATFTATGGIGSAGIITSVELRGGNQALIGMINAAAGADSKVWQNYIDASGTLHMSVVNDALTLAPDWLKVTRSGGTPLAIAGYGPVAGVTVDMTPDASTFTISLTGCTAGVTGTATWRRSGKMVIINIPALVGTSTTTSATLTGIPAAIQPATLSPIFAVSGVSGEDNNATALVSVQILAGSGTWNLWKNTSLTGFTAAGQKGLAVAIQLAYLLD